MTEWDTDKLVDWDKRFVWHPFTDMREWCAPEHEPLVLVEGRGALLRDSKGREYIDGNSSIWTNIHGHNHPHINAAIRRQLGRVAHTSFLEIAKIAAVVIEPLVQGAAGMRLWPSGTLRAVREWCSRTDTLLIVDEVMTGFGRTGRMFASEHESVVPDMIVLGKGLTGGYLPLAVTLISEKLFSAFNGSVAEGKALAYGHSYTGNALGCAAAKASLEVFEKESVLEALQPKIRDLSSALAGLRELPGVKEVRQCGFIAGVEMQDSLVAAGPAMAAAVCIEARRHGLLTRPISNVVVLMPPLCITIAQLTKAVEALRASITEVWRCSKPSARKDAEEVTA